MELSPCTPPPGELSKDTKKPSEASPFGGSHNYKTKQTTVPSFIGRLCFNTYLAHVDGTSPKEILRL
jgi:hypothetical protein